MFRKEVRPSIEEWLEWSGGAKPSSSRTEPIMPDDILNLKIDLGRTQDVNEFLAVV
jgi:hypothetical protein